MPASSAHGTGFDPLAHGERVGMSVLKLAKYTGDDQRLHDTGDAEFVKRKISADTVLDFDGVVNVSGPFLDALFELESPESLADRVVGANSAVDAALAAWADRRSRPAPMERQQRRPKVRIPHQRPAPVVVERAPTKDDRFTPTRLVQRLRHALRGYIESAYPLSDPLLVKSRRLLLESEAAGHLLAQDPFIETTPRYALSSGGYLDLGLPAGLGGLLDRLSHAESAISS